MDQGSQLVQFEEERGSVSDRSYKSFLNKISSNNNLNSNQAVAPNVEGYQQQEDDDDDEDYEDESRANIDGDKSDSKDPNKNLGSFIPVFFWVQSSFMAYIVNLLFGLLLIYEGQVIFGSIVLFLMTVSQVLSIGLKYGFKSEWNTSLGEQNDFRDYAIIFLNMDVLFFTHQIYVKLNKGGQIESLFTLIRAYITQIEYLPILVINLSLVISEGEEKLLMFSFDNLIPSILNIIQINVFIFNSICALSAMFSLNFFNATRTETFLWSFSKFIELNSKIIPLCAALTILTLTRQTHIELMVAASIIVSFNLLMLSLTKSYESWLGLIFNGAVYFYRIVAIFPFGEEEYLFTDSSPQAIIQEKKKKEAEEQAGVAAQSSADAPATIAAAAAVDPPQDSAKASEVAPSHKFLCIYTGDQLNICQCNLEARRLAFVAQSLNTLLPLQFYFICFLFDPNNFFRPIFYAGWAAYGINFLKYLYSGLRQVKLFTADQKLDPLEMQLADLLKQKQANQAQPPASS